MGFICTDHFSIPAKKPQIQCLNEPLAKENAYSVHEPLGAPLFHGELPQLQFNPKPTDEALSSTEYAFNPYNFDKSNICYPHQSSIPLYTSTSGIVEDEQLIPYDSVLRCKQCHTHICRKKLIISNNFYGCYGPALFVSKVLNTELGESRDYRKMRTGWYLVKSIYCRQCHNNLGWKYLYSGNTEEKYKQGKYVIERMQLEVSDC